MTEEESLPELPKGWVWANLGLLARQINPGFPSGKWKRDDDQAIPHLRPMNIDSKGEIDLSNLKYVSRKDYDPLLKGDVLFNNTNSPKLLGKTAVIKKDTNWAYSNHMTRIRLVTSDIEPAFVSSYLQNLFVKGFFQMHCVHHVNQASVNIGFLAEKVNIPIPPFSEQGRVVCKLEELFTRLDAGVESLRNVKAQLQLYRQAVLKHAFNGKLTEEWRKTHEFKIDTRLVKNSHKEIIEQRKKTGKRTYENLFPINYGDLPVIPTNWVWVRFEEAIYVIDYRGRTPPFSLEGIPHLRSNNIKDGKIVWENLKYISKKDYQKYMVRGYPQESDILFTTEAPLGEIAFVPDQKFSIAQRVIILRPNREILNPEFLFYQLMSERFKGRLLRKGTGTTVTGVSYRNLRQVELVIPPLEEQKQIVDYIKSLLSVVDEIGKVINQNLLYSEHLRQSVLKIAFEGKLVAQDPSDEPAERLLERIRKEKENNNNQKRKTTRKNRNQRRLDGYVE